MKQNKKQKKPQYQEINNHIMLSNEDARRGKISGRLSSSVGNTPPNTTLVTKDSTRGFLSEITTCADANRAW